METRRKHHCGGFPLDAISNEITRRTMKHVTGLYRLLGLLTVSVLAAEYQNGGSALIHDSASTATYLTSGATDSSHITADKTQSSSTLSHGRVYDFSRDFGGIPNNSSHFVCEHNTQLFNRILQQNASSNTIVFDHADACERNPTTVANRTNLVGCFYCFHHGIVGRNLSDSLIQIGHHVTLRFERIRHDENQNTTTTNETEPSGSLLEPRSSILIENSWNVTIHGGAGGTNNGSRLVEGRWRQRFSHPEDHGSRPQLRTSVIDGRGSQYWGIPYVDGFLRNDVHHRPVLLRFRNCDKVRVNDIVFQDSPSTTLQVHNTQHVQISDTSIVNRRTKAEGHGFVDLSAFDTIGIEVLSSYAGLRPSRVGSHNIHIHDTDIWTQDQCIIIKALANEEHNDSSGGSDVEISSSNITIENVNASGFGFAILAQGLEGQARSHGASVQTSLRNVTFLNSYIHRSIRGIQLAFRSSYKLGLGANNNSAGHDAPAAVIEDVRFENITLEGTHLWSIWIGPEQRGTVRAFDQTLDREKDVPGACFANPCSMCWPFVTSTKAKPSSHIANFTASDSPSDIPVECNIVPKTKFRNIGMKGIRINNPRLSPGVILADKNSSPIEGLVFDSVRVTRGRLPFTASGESEDLTNTFPGLRQPIDDAYIPKESRSSDDDYYSDDVNVIPEPPEPLVETNGLTAFGVWLIVLLFVLILSVTSLLFFDFSREVRQRMRSQSRRTRRVRFDESVISAAVADDDDKSNDGNQNDIDNGINVEVSRLEDSPSSTSSFNYVRVYTRCLVTPYHLLGILGFLCGALLLTIQNYSGQGPDWGKSDSYFLCQGVCGGVAKGNTWPVPDCFEKDTPWWWFLARLAGGDSLAFVLPLAFVVILGILYTASFYISTTESSRRDRDSDELGRSLPRERRRSGSFSPFLTGDNVDDLTMCSEPLLTLHGDSLSS